MEKKRGLRKMATQLAPTPTIYGEEAKRILEEAQRKPSEKSKKNAKKMIEFYSQFEKRKG